MAAVSIMKTTWKIADRPSQAIYPLALYQQKLAISGKACGILLTRGSTTANFTADIDMTEERIKHEVTKYITRTYRSHALQYPDNIQSCELEYNC